MEVLETRTSSIRHPRALEKETEREGEREKGAMEREKERCEGDRERERCEGERERERRGRGEMRENYKEK